MADPVKSTARWKAKYNLQRVNETLNDLREDMAMRYEVAMTELSAMEGKVKEVINAFGVSTCSHSVLPFEDRRLATRASCACGLDEHGIKQDVLEIRWPRSN